MLGKVYLIDDDQVTLYLTQVTFELFSPESECVLFENALDAYQQLIEDVDNNTLPNLVLLDLNMPLMDGFDVLAKLEHLSASFLASNCFVYVLTSSVDEQDRLKSLKSPLVVDLIEKPFSEEKLEEIRIAIPKLKLSHD